ncbi:hypothetical protein SADUNF_Sadunf02G0101900 [Salix dunnii]|uniref:Cytochrome P450 n=1 Tax=Salix dunnii TaxID=1413687 RepID=A0A835N762_9ROSI|nr:hypothetical protein SADUNF_Sadunf02G0101900 [Salix dunnii]
MRSVHYDPNLWEELTKFKPERFHGPEGKDGFMYLPFGAGRRACPREGLATRIGGLALEGNYKTMIEVLLTLQESEPECYKDETIKDLMLYTGPDRLIDEADLAQLAYLRSIINETLTMYPPTPLLVPRESSEVCLGGGFRIPRGTKLFVNMWAIQNDLNIWLGPGKFKPKRFDGLERASDGLILMPFGSCPGEGLALRTRMGDRLVDMTERPGFTMAKAQPLKAMCRPRPGMLKLFSQ